MPWFGRAKPRAHIAPGRAVTESLPGVCRKLPRTGPGGFPRKWKFAAVSGQSIRRSDETLLTEWSDGLGERSGGGAGRAGFLGQASLTACGSSPLAGSLARGRRKFTRLASTQAESSPSRRGVETVKFGRDRGGRKTPRVNCQPRHEPRELKGMATNRKYEKRHRTK
jgi:hypothetical protein